MLYNVSKINFVFVDIVAEGWGEALENFAQTRLLP